MSKMKISVLHRNRHFLDECAEILNEEWSRSKSARLHSLEKSNDNFPINLVLVADRNGHDTVIGHSRLSVVHGRKEACLVESVVVRKADRGKGYGRVVMEKTEEFAAGHGLKTMYLSTHDKQDFYKHLGYEFCKPVVSFGVSTDLIPEHLIKNLSLDEIKNDPLSSTKVQKDSDKYENKESVTQINNNSASLPLPSGLPPPPPPPPPPAVPSRGGKNTQITRFDPAAISWMKKDLVLS